MDEESIKFLEICVDIYSQDSYRESGMSKDKSIF